MNFKSLKKIDMYEALILVVFVLYLIFPITTPSSISPYIESPIGLLVIFSISIALFVYSHPCLAVLYLFVAYTLLRRSATVQNNVNFVQYTKTTKQNKNEAKKQVADATPPTEEPRNVNPGSSQPVTLEEEIVSEKSPIGVSDKISFVQSSYKPVATNTNGVSFV